MHIKLHQVSACPRQNAYHVKYNKNKCGTRLGDKRQHFHSVLKLAIGTIGHRTEVPGNTTHRVPCAVLCLVSQSCPILCNPIDYSPPGSSVHGILQARTLEWAAMLSSRGSSHPGTEPRSPALRADSLLSKPLGKPIEYPAAAAAAKSLQSCLTLCDPIDGSPADSTIPGIL